MLSVLMNWFAATAATNNATRSLRRYAWSVTHRIRSGF